MHVLRSWGMAWWTGGIAIAFAWATVRKSCYSWRAFLLEGSLTGIYPLLTLHERRFILEPNPDFEEAMKEVPQEKVYGTVVREEFLTREETDFILDALPTLTRKYGRKLTREQKSNLVGELDSAKLDSSFLDDVRFISDAYEDPREPKGVWGIGDAMRQEELPPIFRRLANRVQENYPYIGALRHVYVNYSPKGKFYIPIKTPHHFFGHDFVIIPVARQKAEDEQGGIVITVSPTQRSKVSDLREVLRSSWGSRDQDVYTPFRGISRFYASARLRCGWGVRPIQYFGHPKNRLPLDPETFRSRNASQSLATLASSVQVQAKFVEFLKNLLLVFAAFFSRTNATPATPDVTVPPQTESESSDNDQAIIALYFEGPVAETKTRNKLRRWEIYAYGEAPTKDTWSWDAEERTIEKFVAEYWWQVPMVFLQDYLRPSQFDRLE